MVVTSNPFLFEYLGGTAQTISSLPNYLNIQSMFTFDGLSPLSWTANTPDFLQNFTDLTNETGYILMSESSSIPYELYSNPQTPPLSKLITNKYQISEYNGIESVIISETPFLTALESIFIFDSSGSILAWTADTPDFLQNFTTFEPGSAYFLINKDTFTDYEFYQSTTTGTFVTGTTGTDNLIGTNRDDTINGGRGVDTMTGLKGNDLYYVDNVGDYVVEQPNEGTDSVISTIGYFALSQNVEVLILSSGAVTGAGNSLNNTIIGNTGPYNRLEGGAGDDLLDGSRNLTGDNTLVGGAGSDTMIGSAETDYFSVDSYDDVIVSGGGIDGVITEIDNYTLPSEMYNLTAGVSATTIRGNEKDNYLTGNSLNNTLIGGDGADTLTADIGMDYYYVNSVDDVVIEASGRGTDTIEVSGITSYTLPNNIEKLVLGADVVDGTGNSLNNTITGNANDNSLTGAGGNDSLAGGDGNDTLQGATSRITGEIDVLVGGAGSDEFVLGNSTTFFYDDNLSSQTGTGDYARIKDFDPLVDSLRLRNGTYYFATPNVNGEQYLYNEKGSIDEVIAILEGTDFPANTPFNASTPLPGLTVVFV